MKDFFIFLRSLVILWCCLFALGTIMLAVFFPVFIPVLLAIRWLWTA